MHASKVKQLSILAVVAAGLAKRSALAPCKVHRQCGRCTVNVHASHVNKYTRSEDNKPAQGHRHVLLTSGRSHLKRTLHKKGVSRFKWFWFCSVLSSRA